ncbi:MAG: proton-conducting transporter membrane subunit, partial [Solirubrobacterales bacterium]
AALPLLRINPETANRAPAGVVNDSPSTAAAMGVSLLALSGLPPSPLFLSELLILLGGVAAGDLLVSAIALIALALGFLGLLHALIEGIVGERTRHHRRRARSRAERPIVALTAVLGSGLLALAAAGLLLPGSGFVDTLAKGAL